MSRSATDVEKCGIFVSPSVLSVCVVQGTVTLANSSGIGNKLMVDSYAYLPPNFEHSLKCDGSATLVVFERRCLNLGSFFQHQCLMTLISILWIFQPGEFLNVKVVIMFSSFSFCRFDPRLED
ncbi:hypothetical protein PTKIN_Ptkin05aG0022800 [Pterospermum kingtungense]